jgi:hypothetical protein
MNIVTRLARARTNESGRKNVILLHVGHIAAELS